MSADDDFDEILQTLINTEEWLHERDPDHQYANLFPRCDQERQRLEDFLDSLEPFRPDGGTNTDMLVELLAKIEDLCDAVRTESVVSPSAAAMSDA
jgi:hypothetical protein